MAALINGFAYYRLVLNHLQRYTKDIKTLLSAACERALRQAIILSVKKTDGSQPDKDGINPMKRNLYLAMALALVLGWMGQHYTVAAHEGAHARNAFTPDSIQWGPAPPFIPAGAQLAVLSGDPTAASGDYTIRLKLPDGYRIPPHFHPLRENVTVISGTFKVGMGDTFDREKMGTFPAGSFAFLDPDMHHYAMAVGDVVVQIHGAAPVKFNYVNPSDDPTRSK